MIKFIGNEKNIVVDHDQDDVSGSPSFGASGPLTDQFRSLARAALQTNPALVAQLPATATYSGSDMLYNHVWDIINTRRDQLNAVRYSVSDILAVLETAARANKDQKINLNEQSAPNRPTLQIH